MVGKSCFWLSLVDQVNLILFHVFHFHQGSAIQLFQRLQGPMEEDTVKAHFEKIILIGQQLPSCRTQVCFPLHCSSAPSQYYRAL